MTETHTRAERIADLLDDDLIPMDDGGGPTFDAPWQARTFGLALALHETSSYDWEEFRRRFVEAVAEADQTAMQADVETTYYERLLACLETLLVEEGVTTPAEIDRRTAEFDSGEREASEFVVTEPHTGDSSAER